MVKMYSIETILTPFLSESNEIKGAFLSESVIAHFSFKPNHGLKKLFYPIGPNQQHQLEWIGCTWHLLNYVELLLALIPNFLPVQKVFSIVENIF